MKTFKVLAATHLKTHTITNIPIRKPSTVFTHHIINVLGKKLVTN
jgi:hypothetical protein